MADQQASRRRRAGGGERRSLLDTLRDVYPSATQEDLVYALGLGSFLSASKWLEAKYPKSVVAQSTTTAAAAPRNLSSREPLADDAGGGQVRGRQRGSAVGASGRSSMADDLRRDYPEANIETIRFALAKGSMQAARTYLDTLRIAQRQKSPSNEEGKGTSDGVPASDEVSGARVEVVASEPAADSQAVASAGRDKLRRVVRVMSGGLAFVRVLNASRTHKQQQDQQNSVSLGSVTSLPDDDSAAAADQRGRSQSPRPQGSPRAASGETQQQQHEVSNHHQQEEPRDEGGGGRKYMDDEEELICGFARAPFFVVSVSVSVIVLAGCILGLALTATNTNFPFREICRQCIIGNHGAWNTSTNQCSSTVSSCTSSDQFCLQDASYCGAPECENLQILSGVRLIPYWALLLLSIISVAFATLYNIAHRFVLRPWWEEFSDFCSATCGGLCLFRLCSSGRSSEEGGMVEAAGNPENRSGENPPSLIMSDKQQTAQDDSKNSNNKVGEEHCAAAHTDLQEEVDDGECDLGEEEVMKLSFLGFTDDKDTNDLDLLFSFFGMEADFYLFLLLLATAHFVYAASIVSTYTAGASLWLQYEVLYVTWLNSGTVAVVLIPICNLPAYLYAKWLLLRRGEHFDPVHKQFLMEKVKSIWVPRVKFLNNKNLIPVLVGVMVTLWMPIVPILVTHTIVGLFVFAPMTLLVATFWLVSYFLVMKRQSENKIVWIASLAFLRFTGTFSCIFLVQAMTNYTVLLYGGHRWVNIFELEFGYRSSRCYFNAIINNITLHIVGLLGIIFS